MAIVEHDYTDAAGKKWHSIFVDASQSITLPASAAGADLHWALAGAGGGGGFGWTDNHVDNNNGGGGGAGGFLDGIIPAGGLPIGTPIPVVIGTHGVGSPNRGGTATKGGDSTFNGQTAKGGGFGGNGRANGGDGGSGGGAGGTYPPAATTPGHGTPGQGCDGIKQVDATHTATSSGGAGGGAAWRNGGAPGKSATQLNGVPVSLVDGTPVEWCTGGHGAGNRLVPTAATGVGKGGTGSGADAPHAGGNGTDGGFVIAWMVAEPWSHVNVGGAWKELVTPDPTIKPPAIPARLEVWLDGSDDSTVTEAGGKVTAWKNKGSAAFTLSEAVTWSTGPLPLPTRGTINGHKSIHFPAGGICTPAGAYDVGKSMTEMTFFAVVHFPTNTGGRLLHLNGSDGNVTAGTRFGVINSAPGSANAGQQTVQVRGTTGGALYVANQTLTRPAGVARIDEWSINMLGTDETRVDGKVIPLAAPNGHHPTAPTENAPCGRIVVGSPRDTVPYDAAHMNRTMTGDMGEIMLFSGPMTAADKKAVRDYLSAKWGIPVIDVPTDTPAVSPPKVVVPAYVNVAGTWKPAAEGWVNVAGVWKKMWP